MNLTKEEILIEVEKMKSKGMSWNQMTKDLNDRGLKTTTGREWKSGTLQSSFSYQKRNGGHQLKKKERIQPILMNIEEDVFSAVVFRGSKSDVIEALKEFTA